ncbi:MAG: hypothetical protein GY810_30035 [Aureispira sp.]|nr:hypothetical protein [Aureispira sp.]
MGSDLYAITVEKIETRKVTLSVNVIHPDVSMFYDDKNIALQLIVGVYWLLKNGYTWDMGIDSNQAQEILNKSPYISQLDDWLEAMHGREIKITKAEYKAIENSKDNKYNNRKVASYGMNGDDYYVSFGTEYSAFIRLADIIILNIEVVDNYLIFEVLEEGVVKHLYEGMHWRSRAYDFSYYAQNEAV